jgi:hypothetical protein
MAIDKRRWMDVYGWKGSDKWQQMLDGHRIDGDGRRTNVKQMSNTTSNECRTDVNCNDRKL